MDLSKAVSFALRHKDASSLVQVLIQEVDKLPYKEKRQLGSNTNDIVRSLVVTMRDLLEHNFLNIDFNSIARSVEKSSWDNIVACRRSEGGSTGIYFIQLQALVDGVIENEIIVAKGMSTDDFARQKFVHDLATDFFHINCPAIRLITRRSDEFNSIQQGVRKLYMPLYEEAFESGGMAGISSPKFLFEQPAIMLMEMVKGKPLCHRTAGQRHILDADYHALGRLFLFDLLIRNTDRLPCRKAMPRAHVYRAEQGNAGNLMFGEGNILWAIDAEMQTKIQDDAMKELYVSQFDSVVYEIINKEAFMNEYKAISKLFFRPVAGMEGILDASLDQTAHWAQLSVEQQDSVTCILELIRIRVRMDSSGYIIARAGGIGPPEDSNERSWRNWVGTAIPRAMHDILEFIEVNTGYPTPNSAYGSFEAGFLSSVSAAVSFRRTILERTPPPPSWEHNTLSPAAAGGGLSKSMFGVKDELQTPHSPAASRLPTGFINSTTPPPGSEDKSLEERLNLELLFTLLDVLCKYEHTLPTPSVRLGSPNYRSADHTRLHTDTVKLARASMKHASNFMSLPARRLSRGSSSSTTSSAVSALSSADVLSCDPMVSNHRGELLPRHEVSQMPSAGDNTCREIDEDMSLPRPPALVSVKSSASHSVTFSDVVVDSGSPSIPVTKKPSWT